MVHYIGLRRVFAFLVDYHEIPGRVNPMKWIKRPVPAIKLVEVLTVQSLAFVPVARSLASHETTCYGVS
jgi:hypothetical protein